MVDSNADVSGYLIRGKKELKSERRIIYTFDNASGGLHQAEGFPLDSDVSMIYHSRAGGFVPPEAGAQSTFSQDNHYGQGGFEGMRFYYSRWGVVMPEPWSNAARLEHTYTVLHPKLAKVVIEHFSRDEDLVRMTLPMSMTPRNFYELAERCYRSGVGMSYPLELGYSDGRKEVISVGLSLDVMGKDGENLSLDLKEMITIFQVLAYTGRLVSTDYYPLWLEMINSGYLRPHVRIGAEDGLKVASVMVGKDGAIFTIRYKAGGFACATLPWGFYLNDDAYKEGLDVMVAPYERISDVVMPSSFKAGGNYLNSLLNINLGLMFGFGEILAFNRHGGFVEGSAENAFVFKQEGDRIVAYTPSIGDGCLPGTTRDRVIRVLERIGIELRYRSLKDAELDGALGIMLTGTGAQMIHVRSVTDLNAAHVLSRTICLASEDSKDRPNAEFVKADFERHRRLINGGQRHPVIDRVQSEYVKMMLDEPSLLAQVHAIDLDTFAKLNRMALEDFTTRKEWHQYRNGYFNQRVDGSSQPDELMRINAAMAKIIKRGFDRRPDPAIPITRVLDPKAMGRMLMAEPGYLQRALSPKEAARLLDADPKFKDRLLRELARFKR
ncbi:MAG: aminotransferase class IV [Candidatus Micrarchaeota archaeon]